MTVKQSHLPRFRLRTCGLWLALGLAVTACSRSGGPLLTAEIDDRQFQRGQLALRAGQNAEALQAFLNVIDKRNGDAPESHLESGRLYLSHLKDPYTAIYHFNRYLELNPNGVNANGVRELIKTAQKTIFQNIAGQTMGDQVDRLELLDKIQSQQAEIASLRAEMQRMSQERQGAPGVVPAVMARPPASAAAAPPVEEVAPVVQPVANAAGQAGGTRGAPTRPGVAAPTSSGRTYVVQQGETLSAISRKIYGTPSRWRAIAELNRDVLPNPNVLKPGIQLKLPDQ